MDDNLIEARHVRDHVVWLRFRDGTAGEVDLGPALRGPVFEPLRDVRYFKTFTVHPGLGTLVWPNEADLAPEFLHQAARANPAPPPPVRDSDTMSSVSVTATDRSDATIGRMPEISRFLGIVIEMYYREHGAPHFHARYGEHRIAVEVESGLVRGTFPERAQRHVLEWTALHRPELLANWERARQRKPLKRIAPLE